MMREVWRLTGLTCGPVELWRRRVIAKTNGYIHQGDLCNFTSPTSSHLLNFFFRRSWQHKRREIISSTQMSSSDEDFQEESVVENNEVIMLLAKGVGVLVGVVAIISWLMIMMILRAIILWSLHMWGVVGVIVCLVTSVLAVMWYVDMSGKHILNVIWCACN